MRGNLSRKMIETGDFVFNLAMGLLQGATKLLKVDDIASDRARNWRDHGNMSRYGRRERGH